MIPNWLTDGVNGSKSDFFLAVGLVIAALILIPLAIYFWKSGREEDRLNKMEKEYEDTKGGEPKVVTFDPDDPTTWQHAIPIGLLTLPAAGDDIWLLIAVGLFMLIILLLSIFGDEIAAILNDIFGRR
jgi:hypothetical protein